VTERRSPRYAWQRNAAFRVAASMPLGIALIAVVAVVLVWGTVADARSGLKIALRTIYGAVWFQALLGALAVSLVCCTLKAMPYRWSHVGFIVTHVSLLLVFAGAVLTINFGAQGEVRIVEGGETDFFFDNAVVRCTDTSSGRLVEIPTSFEATAEQLRERFDGTVDVAPHALGGVEVVVDRYYPDATPFGTPEIRAAIPAQGIDVSIPAVADPEKRIPVEGTAHSLTVVQLFYDWKDNEETGGPDNALNPAARVVLHAPDGDFDLVLFARMPGFSMGEHAAPEGVSLVYRYAPESPRMRDWQAADSAIRVTVSDEEGNQTVAWVRRYDRNEITVGSKRVMIEYPRRVPLGFALVLDEFVARQYPHSAIPAAYESHLTMKGGNAPARAVTVAMNAPVKIGGYLFYQSSFGHDPATGRALTVLSLSRDPGTTVLYAGFASMLVGLIVTFYISPQLRRREQAQATGTL